jgi:hypothetical protein
MKIFSPLIEKAGFIPAFLVLWWMAQRLKRDSVSVSEAWHGTQEHAQWQARNRPVLAYANCRLRPLGCLCRDALISSEKAESFQDGSGHRTCQAFGGLYKLCLWRCGGWRRCPEGAEEAKATNIINLTKE